MKLFVVVAKNIVRRNLSGATKENQTKALNTSVQTTTAHVRHEVQSSAVPDHRERSFRWLSFREELNYNPVDSSNTTSALIDQ